jgi:hypothetical protein
MTTKNIGVKNNPNNVTPIILLKTAISRVGRISDPVVHGGGAGFAQEILASPHRLTETPGRGRAFFRLLLL